MIVYIHRIHETEHDSEMTVSGDPVSIESISNWIYFKYDIDYEKDQILISLFEEDPGCQTPLPIKSWIPASSKVTFRRKPWCCDVNEIVVPSYPVLPNRFKREQIAIANAKGVLKWSKIPPTSIDQTTFFGSGCSGDSNSRPDKDFSVCTQKTLYTITDSSENKMENDEEESVGIRHRSEVNVLVRSPKPPRTQRISVERNSIRKMDSKQHMGSVGVGLDRHPDRTRSRSEKSQTGRRGESSILCSRLHHDEGQIYATGVGHRHSRGSTGQSKPSYESRGPIAPVHFNYSVQGTKFKSSRN